MKSHDYESTAGPAMAALGRPLLGVVFVALLLHGLNASGLLPAPKPIRDMDRTVMWDRVQSSRSKAPVVLVGDSSCLMGVSGADMRVELERPVKNLGAMSFLDLGAFATLASNAVAAGNPPGTLILLVHPEFLTRPAADSQYGDFFSAQLRGEPEPAEGFGEKIGVWSGVTAFRDRVETRVRPFPLQGEFRAAYGFNDGLLEAMHLDDGGLVDPRTYINSGISNATVTLSPRLEAQAAAFRKSIPPGVKLYVGITPRPGSEAGPGYNSTYIDAVTRLASWMGPDVTPLVKLPPTLADDSFATRTHLSASGRLILTHRLLEDVFGHALVPGPGPR